MSENYEYTFLNENVDTENEYEYNYEFDADSDIKIIINIKNQLKKIPSKFQDEEYKKIMKSVNDYLSKHCIHDIVTDYVDIDPDTSKTIHYCEKCMIFLS